MGWNRTFIGADEGTGAAPTGRPVVLTRDLARRFHQSYTDLMIQNPHVHDDAGRCIKNVIGAECPPKPEPQTPEPEPQTVEPEPEQFLSVQTTHGSVIKYADASAFMTDDESQLIVLNAERNWVGIHARGEWRYAAWETSSKK